LAYNTLLSKINYSKFAIIKNANICSLADYITYLYPVQQSFSTISKNKTAMHLYNAQLPFISFI